MEVPNIEYYPPVAQVSNDGKTLYLADGTEVNLTQLAVAYNELRSYLAETSKR